MVNCKRCKEMEAEIKKLKDLIVRLEFDYEDLLEEVESRRL